LSNDTQSLAHFTLLVSHAVPSAAMATDIGELASGAVPTVPLLLPDAGVLPSACTTTVPASGELPVPPAAAQDGTV
jgi:hypothetical protein